MEARMEAQSPVGRLFNKLCKMVVDQINGTEEIVQKWLDSGSVLMFKSKGFLDRSDGDEKPKMILRRVA